MNREIKFRAWDKLEKKMNTTGCIGGGSSCMFIDVGFNGKMSLYNAHGLPDGSNPAYDKPVNDRFELMQYSGMKDSNEREFYEGDIVKSSKDGRIYVITWEWSGFRLCRQITENGTAWNELMHDDKILGNIFENPELIPDDTKI